jgi:hypothetical protein
MFVVGLKPHNQVIHIGQVPALPTNIGPGSKWFLGVNALAYYKKDENIIPVASQS